MKMKGLCMGVIACWLALTPFLSGLAFANEVDDKRAELNDLQIQMQEMEARRAKARREAEAEEQKQVINHNLKALINRDNHCEGDYYTISSVYFDTFNKNYNSTN